MFKIDISLKGTESPFNAILCVDNVVVSGEIEIPFVIKSDKNRSVIIIGHINNYNGDSVDIDTAAKRIFRKEARETDFYGDFICLAFSPEWVNIYTDPFGQFPVYYTINTNGNISLSTGARCKSLSSTNKSVDIDFIFNYISTGEYLEGRTAIVGLNILSPGFKYSFSVTGVLSREYIINRIFSKAEVTSPYNILKKSIAQKVACYDKLVLELSGGVESSSIAAILACYKNEKDIRFLTYYDKYSLSSNELKYAKKVSDYFNVKLEVIEGFVE
jgi:hypothetical protein